MRLIALCAAIVSLPSCGTASGTAPASDPSAVRGPRVWSSAGHRLPVWSLSFSPDGRRLASGGKDGRVILWNADTGKSEWVRERPGKVVRCVAVLPDGETVRSAEWGGTVMSWSEKDEAGTCLLSLNLRQDFRFGLAPGGARAVAVTSQKSFCGIDLDSSLKVFEYTVQGVLDGSDRCRIALSEDGARVAVCHGNARILVYDPSRDGTPREFKLKIPGQDVQDLGIRAHPPVLGYVDRWGVFLMAFDSGGAEVKVGGLDGEMTHELEFSPDGRYLTWCHWDGRVGIAEVVSGEKIMEFRIPEGECEALAFSPRGSRLALGTSVGVIVLLDLPALVREHAGRKGGVATANLDAAWNQLASQESAFAYVALWDLVAAKDAAVELILRRLLPGGDAAGTQKLIDDLGHDDLHVREDSERQLTRRALESEAELSSQVKLEEEGERRVRMKRILVHLEEPITLDLEVRRRMRCVEILERIGSPRAAEVLELMANDPRIVCGKTEARVALSRMAARGAAK